MSHCHELLARTGTRSSELQALTVDAVVQIGSAYWLRIPIGKLHNGNASPSRFSGSTGRGVGDGYRKRSSGRVTAARSASAARAAVSR